MLDLSKRFPQGAKGKGCEESGYESKKTTPPKRYTEASLLADMENASKFLTDEKQREALREAEGIGTPATRAATINDLKTEGYIKNKGKEIISQEKGRSLIKQSPQDMIDVGKTAIWEQYFKEIAGGRVSHQEFINAQKTQTKKIIDETRQRKISIAGAKQRGPLECHPCAVVGCMDGGEILLREGKFGKYWSCSRRNDGCTNKIKGSEKQDPYIDDEAPVQEIKGSGEPCPKCKKEKLVTRVVKKEGPNKGKSFLACPSRSCGHTVFDTLTSGDGHASGGGSTQSKPEPLPGEGTPCKHCGNGILATRKVFKKESPAFGKRFLACSDNCGAKAIWEDQIPAQGIVTAERLVADTSKPWRLPGEGKPCPSCGSDLVTQKVSADNKKAANKRFLKCSNPTCTQVIWEERAMKLF